MAEFYLPAALPGYSGHRHLVYGIIYETAPFQFLRGIRLGRDGRCSFLWGDGNHLPGINTRVLDHSYIPAISQSPKSFVLYQCTPVDVGHRCLHLYQLAFTILIVRSARIYVCLRRQLSRNLFQ